MAQFPGPRRIPTPFPGMAGPGGPPPGMPPGMPGLGGPLPGMPSVGMGGPPPPPPSPGQGLNGLGLPFPTSPSGVGRSLPGMNDMSGRPELSPELIRWLQFLIQLVERQGRGEMGPGRMPTDIGGMAPPGAPLNPNNALLGLDMVNGLSGGPPEMGGRGMAPNGPPTGPRLNTPRMPY